MVSVAEITRGRASEGGHWYDREGRAVYEIRGKNGLMRNVNLGDARKLGLVPGVSSILAMEAKPALERWKIEQALMSALTLPRYHDETDDQFIHRAREDSQEQARKAAARGTAIHAALQGSFEGKPIAAEDLPYVVPIREQVERQFGSSGWFTEQSFACPFGYGGKIDLNNAECVLDFKGKDFDESKTAEDLAWPDNAMQLVAYSIGARRPNARCANVFFSRTVPGLIRIHEWSTRELGEHWRAFECLLRLWQIRRKYDSSFSAAEAA